MSIHDTRQLEELTDQEVVDLSEHLGHFIAEVQAKIRYIELGLKQQGGSEDD